MKRGTWSAVAAYLLWGTFPIYFKALQAVPPLQMLAHRIVWSLVLLAGVLLLRRGWVDFLRAARGKRTLAAYLLAAVMLAVNWGVYIAAVTSGHVVEASLGYFINPLINVLLGATLLRERLRPAQWAAIGLALCGVVCLTVYYGGVPWIGLVLAFSFGLYGLIKRLAPLGALHSLALESTFLFLPALGFLLITESAGVGAFGHSGTASDVLLVLAGPVTVAPLLLFSVAARSIPFTSLGVLQYIAPTAQFLLGVLVYGEPFTPAHALGFGLIWAGLLVYTVEGGLSASRTPVEMIE
jgi:chloramphenicol-sensitive protein RarD